MRRLLCLAALAALAGPARADDTPAVPVALFVDAGVGGKGPRMMHETLTADGFRVDRVDAGLIRAGALDAYRVLIVPGGSSSIEGRTLGADGRNAIRRFVEGGGVYVGVCAGCYLASCEYDWSLHILPATIVDRKNSYRGRADLALELTPEGRAWFGRPAADVKTIYHNSPVLKAKAGAAPLIPLAMYKEEAVRKGAEPGLMVGTPAVAAARYGAGWAIGVSPHPEQTEGLRDLVPAAVRWALRHPEASTSAP